MYVCMYVYTCFRSYGGGNGEGLRRVGKYLPTYLPTYIHTCRKLSGG